MKIIYIVNNAAFFCSHRLPIAIAARERGDEVELITGLPGSKIMEELAFETLKKNKIGHEVIPMNSDGVNPFIQLYSFIKLLIIILRKKPDLIHCVSPKAIIFGGLCGYICRVPSMVLAVSGMGFIYSSNKKTYLLNFLRIIFRFIFNMISKHKNLKIIVQNKDDRAFISKTSGIRIENIMLIHGSGVHINNFSSITPAKKENIILFPARLMKDKGICEFVNAAKLIKLKNTDWRFVLVGTLDYKNPSSISQNQIKDWIAEGCVEWWGFKENMNEIYEQVSIVCLPSYREGLPKVLLEAAAAKCATITTNVPGCRDAIIDGKTGDLIPVRNSKELANCILRLINDPNRIKKYGKAGSKLIREKFNVDCVVSQHLKLYNDLEACRS
ncbi:glycosyltransferase family 4 protein [Amylibacter sp.]|nr:glycosyltransferase family 4 protein [Amylibacter sp.]